MPFLRAKRSQVVSALGGGRGCAEKRRLALPVVIVEESGKKEIEVLGGLIGKAPFLAAKECLWREERGGRRRGSKIWGMC